MKSSIQIQERTNTLFYFTNIGIFLILKYLYILSNTKDLTFLLKPINRIIELVIGLKSIITAEGAFSYSELNIIIDKSCSGFNFFILCFMMLACLCLKYFDKIVHKLGVIVFALLAAYLLTIGVNCSRIVTSLVFENQVHLALNIDRKIIHQSIGITTNISFLILIYLLVEQTLKLVHKTSYQT